MGKWYSRPVLFVTDVDAALEFYGRLGFAEAWKFAEGDAPSLPAPATRTGPSVVAQVARDECEIIFSKQWPDKVGTGMLFIELTDADWAALPDAFAAGAVEFVRGWWGYRSLIVTDPDGNQLYFPDPGDPGGRG
ncbi:MAG: bleomycin resistance family protein [Brevundimonas sp.]|nr:MAG: bleomycin resistance family protein [Brevundimonas sp.]